MIYSKTSAGIGAMRRINTLAPQDTGDCLGVWFSPILIIVLHCGTIAVNLLKISCKYLV